MKALVVLLQQRVVDARALVEAVDVRLGDEAHEVVVADEVLRVQAEVEALLVLLARRVVARRGDVGLHAEDGLHALGAAFVVEGLEGEEVAVVGDGEGAHPQRLRLRDERLDQALPVEERIGRMQVKMDEV